MSYLPFKDFDKIVIVKKAGDLSGTLDTDTQYLIDGEIDMGTTSITVPQGGLTIMGLGVNVSKLFSTENNYTMFVDDGVYSGNLFIGGMTIDVSGTSSKVFDLDNAGNGNAVEMTRVNFEDCTSLGSLDSYRQLLAIDTGYFNLSDGVEFVGAWSGGARITTSIVRNTASAYTLFKAGAGLTFDGRFITDINTIDQTDLTVADLSASNFNNNASFQIFRADFSGVTTPLPNIASSSVKARFSKTRGIRDTYVGSIGYISSTSATVISTVNTKVKVAGTFVYRDEVWFNSTANNAHKYASDEPIEVTVHVSMSISGGNNDNATVYIRKYDSSAAAYVDNPDAKLQVTLDGTSGKFVGISLFTNYAMDENDRIEFWIENNTNTTNITATQLVAQIEERSS